MRFWDRDCLGGWHDERGAPPRADPRLRRGTWLVRFLVLLGAAALVALALQPPR